MPFRGNPALRWWAAALTDQTDAEQALEPAVASLGLRYRCQHPVLGYRYRLDFALLDEGLAIEVDDDSHLEPEKQVEDLKRTEECSELGWKIVRCTNEEALTDPWGTVDRLMAAADLPHRTEQRQSPVGRAAALTLRPPPPSNKKPAKRRRPAARRQRRSKRRG